jgi:hypothetical protein
MIILKSEEKMLERMWHNWNGFTCVGGAGAGKPSVIICHMLLKPDSGTCDLAVGSLSFGFAAGCGSRKQLDFVNAIAVLHNDNFCDFYAGSEFEGCKSSVGVRDAGGEVADVVMKNKLVIAGSNKLSCTRSGHRVAGGLWIILCV